MKRRGSLLLLVPLLGATQTLNAALGMTLMIGAVLGVFAVCMSPLRERLTGTSALLASLILAATVTSSENLVAQRWFLPWQQTSELYIGLIALHCVVLEFHGFFREPFAASFKRCAMFGALMLVIGGLREIIGHGTLGRGLSAHWQGLVLFPEGLHLFTLVPGAFVLSGLLLAARQAWTRRNSVIKETHRP
ncbi:NADH:quinone oxidoreductase [Pseudomonas moraviensis subsp. stanleyae]|uniref:Rnf-Nqr domain containing protein n=1 Tax=Pseudomonas moraviensis TaxID=321662 RepID=UPI002E32069A|nr:Rnf-Nqr domain containing protein [Pseudomonas moraviensis]MED7667193.1 NADH:quinone oxidoreductase [Pseudomonas moraviensis subsp. stanleyae]